VGVDVDDGLGKSLRSFLRKVVPDAAVDPPVRISAGEFVGVGARLRMGRTVGVALEGDRGNSDDRGFGEPILQLGVLGFAVGQPRTPPVVVDDDVDVIRVLERPRGVAAESGDASTDI